MLWNGFNKTKCNGFNKNQVINQSCYICTTSISQAVMFLAAFFSEWQPIHIS